MREDTPLYDLILDVISSFEGQYYHIAQKKELIKILIPAPFAYLLRHELNSMFATMNNTMNPVQMDGFLVYGYEIKIGYEMAVIMYHINCTSFVSNAPFIRVPLMPGVESKEYGNSYSRVIFKMERLDTTDKNKHFN